MAEATRWWTERTEAGSEGMVVKPEDFVARTERGVAALALKCRGREYLRIIYGPEYTAPDQLERLRRRNTGRKTTLALREFALGIEALEQLLRGRPCSTSTGPCSASSRSRPSRPTRGSDAPAPNPAPPPAAVRMTGPCR